MAARQSFPPLVWEDSEILILGTIPSSSSIENGEYYYHYANYIWKYLAEIFDTVIPKSWQEKTAFLRKYHIALWDMYVYSEISGSLDKGLREFNDIAGFLGKHPTIVSVLLNGKKTTQAFHQYQKVDSLLPLSIKVYSLPSTSGANTRMPGKKVLLAWKKVLS